MSPVTLTEVERHVQLGAALLGAASRACALSAFLLAAACAPPEDRSTLAPSSSPRESASAFAPAPRPTSQLARLDDVVVRSGPVGPYATIAGKLSSSTVILRSGVRWLAGPHSLIEERSPLPLVDAVIVPTSSGGVLVGADDWTVYRFDDPLGAGAPIYEATDGAIEELGSVPGAVHVWPDDVYVDVASGDVAHVTSAAPVQPRSIRYLDDQRGVAKFAGSGDVFVTRDRGRTWATSTAPAREIGHYRAPLLLAAQAELGDGDDAPLDVRWIEATGRDPLYLAAVNGLLLPSGAALIRDNDPITRHTRVARIDLATGQVLEVLEIDGRCIFASTREGPIALCSSAEGSESRPVREGPLALGEPLEAWVPAGAGTERTTPAGGLASRGACERSVAAVAEARMSPAEHRDEMCVRQPDGSWVTLSGRMPRPDGTVLGWTDDPGSSITSMDLDGATRVLATMPPDRTVSNVSEDHDGRIWVLGLDAAPRREGESRHPAFFVAEITGTALEWTPLDGYACGIIGATTVCATGEGTSVRKGRGAARWLEAPTQSSLFLSPLGFSSNGRAHLGFEQGELAPPYQEPRSTELDATIDCERAGPARAGAPPPTPFGARDPLVDPNVHVTKWSALRARSAAARLPGGPFRVDDLERVDRLGLRRVLRAQACAPGARGKPVGLEGAHVQAVIPGDRGLDYDATVFGLDDGERVCVQRIQASRGGPELRFDAVTGRAEAWGDHPGVQPLRCTLAP